MDKSGLDKPTATGLGNTEVSDMIEISRYPLNGDILVYDANDNKFKPMSLTEYFKKYPVLIDAR